MTPSAAIDPITIRYLDDPRCQLGLLRRLYGLTDAQAVLTELRETLGALEGVDGFLINLMGDGTTELVCQALSLPAPFRRMEPVMLDSRLPLSRPDLVTSAFLQARPADIGDGGDAAAPHTFTARFRDLGMAGIAAVPIMAEDEAVGAVTLLRLAAPWDAASLEQLQALLSLFGPILRQTRYYGHVQQREAALGRRANEQQRFLDFINHVNNLQEPAAVRQRVAAEFLERYPFDLVAFLGRDGEHLVMEEVVLRPPHDPAIGDALLAHYHQHPYWLGAADGATPLAFLQQTTFHFHDIQEVLHLPMSPKDRQGIVLMGTPRTGLMMPILYQGESIGVLWLLSLSQAFQLSEADRTLIQSLAAFLGTALVNARLFAQTRRRREEAENVNQDLQDRVQQLKHQASRDPLTGLLNFGAFQETLAREVAAQAAGGASLSLAVIDIDHFKRFNDSYGHSAGNEVLKSVAERLKRLSRARDLPCRYGGEEFVLILPACDAAGARALAERIREDLRRHPAHGTAPVTVSIGLATCRDDDSPETLFKRADEALYQAKRLGRDRVEMG